MKGLLIKDFFVITKQAKLFLLIIFIFAVTAGEQVVPLVICYGAMLPITALAYDEQSKWSSFAKMMPYSAFDIVFSKYLLGYIVSLALGAVCIAVQAVSNIIRGAEPFNEFVWISTLLYLFAALFIQAVNLPAMLGFGVEKGRLWFMIFTIMLIILIIIGGDSVLSAVSNIDTIPTALLAALILLATVAVNVLSLFVSMKVYKNKR